MELLKIILLLLFAGLCYSFCKKNKKFSTHDPLGPLEMPIIGSLHRLGENPHRTYSLMAEKYNGIFKVWLGDVYTVVVSEPQLVKLIWIKNFESFSNRAHSPSLDILSGGFKNISMADDYETWRRNRQPIAQVFTKTKLRQNSVDVIERNTRLLVDVMKDFESTKQPFLPGLYMVKYAFNIILNMGFNTEIPYNESVDEGLLAELAKPIDEVVLSVSAGNYWDYFGSWLAKPYLLYKKTHNPPLDKIMSVISRIHKEHLDTLDKENPRDILDQLIIDFPDPCDLLNIKMIASDLFIAGTDTSASTLEWLLGKMVNHQEYQQKAYEELVKAVGPGNFVTAADLVKTPYTIACIKESLRIMPISPLSFPFVAQHDIVVGDYYFPKNTQVIQNVYGIHNEKKYWVDPEVYRPERFIGNNHTDHYIPFSCGPRNCVGQALATDVVAVCIANILMNFKMTSSTGQPLDETEKFSVTLRPKHEYTIFLEPRSNKPLTPIGNPDQ
eukprot:gene14180-16719_t